MWQRLALKFPLLALGRRCPLNRLFGSGGGYKFTNFSGSLVLNPTCVYARAPDTGNSVWK
uniref:Uncharacterized protein n=1 Tax=Megaselia scalaris TaxID=36166 RepID=T1GHR6_MEGSC